MLRKETLRQQRDFVTVYSKGKSAGSKYVVVLYKKNRFEYTRISFVASKKVGNSIARNRARRLMRESYYSLKDEIKNGFDIVFVARNTIESGVKMDDVKKSMNRALKFSNLLK